MMATVPYVTSGLGLRKFQADGFLLTRVYKVAVHRDSSVSVVTGYGMDDQGIESRWERDFPHLFRLALEPILPPI